MTFPHEFEVDFRSILDLIKAAVILLKPDGEILYANQRALELLAEENLKGKNIAYFFDEKDRRIFWPNIQRILAEKGVYEGEGFLVPRGKEGFVAHLHFVRYDMGEFSPVVFTFQNVSQVKALERSLRKTRHLAFLGRMLTDISHHIRNPILVIGGLARRLKENPQRAATYAAALVYQCERLENLLQALSRLVLMPTPRFRLVELKEIIELVKERFQLEISGEEPELSLPREIPSLAFYTDPELLAEALVELIQNALEAHQAVGQKGPVLFRCTADQEKVDFWVKDYGEGIKVEALPFIFNPFFTTKPGHFGMGLALVSRITEELAGEIKVENTYQPTVFRLSLPFDRRRPERRRPLSQEVKPET